MRFDDQYSKGNRLSLQLSMELYTGKRGVDRNTAPRKGYNISSKNAADERDQNTQFCNRIGCSGRIKYSQNAKVETSDKAKCSKPSCQSSHVNEISSNSSIMTSSKKPQLDSKRKLTSRLKFGPSESSLSSESESSSGYQSNPRKNLGKKDTLTEIGTSSNVRPRKILHQKSGPAYSVSSGSKSPSVGPFTSSNVKYKSGSNILPPSRSSPNLKSLVKNTMKKKNPQGQSSGISISESGQSSFASGDSNSTWNRRSVNVNSRMRLSSRQNERPFNIGSQSSSSSNDDERPFTFSEPSFSHLMNRNGIAEVLLALERIEQEEELTHEQVLALETSLFLSGLNLYDQHRDMRMDIDNMSYEDLLALEERMGTVSTAVSEEALSKCVSKGVYQSAPSEVRIIESGEDGDDTKCSICQEEFVSGDEIGKLVECQHGYHETCINQWLRVKNWCPVCKASATPSPQSSSSS